MIGHIYGGDGLLSAWFIWEHFDEPIQMSEIVAASGMSRRGLEHAFRQHLHRSIHNELNRYRIERAK